MASLGPTYAGTGSVDLSFGFVNWASPGNITASDNVRALASPTGGSPTYYLTATNFSFSVPTGATVDGIVVEVEQLENSGGKGTAKDARVRIIKGGTIGATDKSNASNWPTTEAFQTYGSSSDLWGETWAYSDINASTFGVAISAQQVTGTPDCYVDSIRITVYYTLSSACERSYPRGVLRGMNRGIC